MVIFEKPFFFFFGLLRFKPIDFQHLVIWNRPIVWTFGVSIEHDKVGLTKTWVAGRALEHWNYNWFTLNFIVQSLAWTHFLLGNSAQTIYVDLEGDFRPTDEVGLTPGLEGQEEWESCWSYTAREPAPRPPTAGVALDFSILTPEDFLKLGKKWEPTLEKNMYHNFIYRVIYLTLILALFKKSKRQYEAKE